MTTPPRPPDRDPQTAEILAVAPLDEVTRARLVRTALGATSSAGDPGVGDPGGRGDPTRRAPGWRRPVALVAGAAALLVGLAVGVAVLAPQGPDDTTATATGRSLVPTTAGVAPAGGADVATPEADRGAIAAAPAPGDPVALDDLGDLGDVSTPTRLVGAVAPRLTARGSFTTTAGPCAATATGRTPIATGAGTVAGRNVVVVVWRSADGSTTVAALRSGSCTPVVTADLP